MTEMTTGSQAMLRALAGAGLLMLAAGCTTETYADRFAQTSAGTPLAKPRGTDPGSATIGRGVQATSPPGAIQGPGATHATRSPWANPRLADAATSEPQGPAIASSGLAGDLPTGAPHPLSPGNASSSLATSDLATGDDVPDPSDGMRIWLAPDGFAATAEDTAAPAPGSPTGDGGKGSGGESNSDAIGGGESDGGESGGSGATTPGGTISSVPDVPVAPTEVQEPPTADDPTAAPVEGVPDRTDHADEATEPLPVARQRLAQPGPDRP